MTTAGGGMALEFYRYAYDPMKQPPCPEKNLKVLIANTADAKLRDKIPGIADF